MLGPGPVAQAAEVREQLRTSTQLTTLMARIILESTTVIELGQISLNRRWRWM
jgi:hypothetical protein